MSSARHLIVAVVALALVGGCGQSGPTPTPPGSPSPTGSRAPTTSPGPAASLTPSATGLQTGGPVEPSPTGGSLQPSPTVGSTDPGRLTIGVEPFAQGMDALTFVTHAGDGTGRLYAVEQRGVIRVVEPDGSVLADPFVDLTDRIRSGGERGLLGLAFHPAHAENRRFFVNYTDTGGDTVVAELGRSGETSADAASERVLLLVDQPFPNHNGGMIAFGPDGYLYIALGDGGGAGDPQGNGQDRSALLGKLLRIDVDVDAGGEAPYGIPADNPFADGADGRPEIWAWGMRNPWRFSFDRETGGLFIGDVGQGAAEEIDFQPPGEGGLNFGWSTMEGIECFGADDCDQTGLTLPVASYERVGNDHCAVTGGYVYRGQEVATLAGTYLFADYCTGQVWGLDADRAQAEATVPFDQLGDVPFPVSSFGEDESGEIYLVDHGGAVMRITAPAQ